MARRFALVSLWACRPIELIRRVDEVGCKIAALLRFAANPTGDVFLGGAPARSLHGRKVLHMGQLERLRVSDILFAPSVGVRRTPADAPKKIGMQAAGI
jgi:hypothetical protein